jgi:hypothetical protein
MNEFDKPRQHVGVGRRQHTVAEIEYVTARGSAARDDIARGLLDDLPRRENHCRIEISLQCVVSADALGRDVERYPPVNSDNVSAGFAHQRQQLTGADAEMNARHT